MKSAIKMNLNWIHLKLNYKDTPVTIQNKVTCFSSWSHFIMTCINNIKTLWRYLMIIIEMKNVKFKLNTYLNYVHIYLYVCSYHLYVKYIHYLLLIYSSQYLKWIKTFHQNCPKTKTIPVLVLAQLWWTFLIHFKCWLLYIELY